MKPLLAAIAFSASFSLFVLGLYLLTRREPTSIIEVFPTIDSRNLPECSEAWHTVWTPVNYYTPDGRPAMYLAFGLACGDWKVVEIK